MEDAQARNAKSLLEQCGIQATPQRLLIAELLFARNQHLTAEQVIHALAAAGTQVSKATVYNTLNLFSAKGLLRHIQVDSERGLFDSNTAHHHHIQVEGTDDLIDVPSGAVEFARLPDLPPGTEAVGVDVVIRVRRQGA